MISIQVPNTFIELGTTDINIKCLINDRKFASILAIQLLRSDANIVSIREKLGVRWQDGMLQRRAVATGSVIDVTSSYLNMKIDRQNVTQNDGGEYFCSSLVQYRDNSTDSEDTERIFLNITGNQIFQL